VVEIRIPPVLRSEVGGKRTVAVEGETVKVVFERLLSEYPSLNGRVLADGELPPFLNVFVDGEDVRVLSGLDTAVGAETTILLLPAVAGGAR
jgi:sulfur-carrier protein